MPSSSESTTSYFGTPSTPVPTSPTSSDYSTDSDSGLDDPTTLFASFENVMKFLSDFKESVRPIGAVSPHAHKLAIGIGLGSTSGCCTTTEPGS